MRLACVEHVSLFILYIYAAKYAMTGKTVREKNPDKVELASGGGLTPAEG